MITESLLRKMHWLGVRYELALGHTELNPRVAWGVDYAGFYRSMLDLWFGDWDRHGLNMQSVMDRIKDDLILSGHLETRINKHLNCMLEYFCLAQVKNCKLGMKYLIDQLDSEIERGYVTIVRSL